MPVTGQLLPGVRELPTGYDVANSLRFNDDSSDYLNNTSVSTVTSRFTFTISLWVKRSTLGAKSMIGTVGGDSTNFGAIWFDSSDRLNCTEGSGGGTLNFITNRVFRDVSAWYHIVLAIDTTQSTESNRVKIYVNGVQETSFSTSTYPPQNSNMHLNRNGKTQYIGRHTDSTNNYYFDGYITEVVWVDGQQLSNTDLGEFDSDTNIWKPIDVSGLTFGLNGFYLDYENSGSLGADVSGNGNNFTVNNLTSIDQSTDTCTNNYSTMNGLYFGSGVTMSEGNLSVAMNASAQFGAFSTIGVSTGKWYMEMKYTVQVAGADRMMVGVSGNPANLREATPIGSGAGYVGADSESFAYYSDGGNSYTNEVATSYGNSWTVNDIIGVYLDLDNNKLYFAKNGTIQNSGTGISITDPASLTTGNYFFAVSDTSGVYGGTIVNNFGSPSFTISSGNTDPNGYGNFEYSPNDGGSASFDSSAKDFYALNTKNLAEYG